MAEILNKYKRWTPRLMVNREREYDFVLSQDNTPTIDTIGALVEKCLISYIDINNNDCIESGGSLVSLEKYSYENAVNDNVELKDFGFTGVDNGKILYDSDTITLDEFVGILTGTTLIIPSGDTRLHLYPVKGNSKYYDYNIEIRKDEWDRYFSFKGGFVQGFFKLFDTDYKILPDNIEDAWNLEFVIRPRTDYIITGNTLNTEHPENNGIFFYIGTRSENKFGRFNGEDITKYPNREGYSGECFDLCEDKNAIDKANKKCAVEILKNFLYRQPTDKNLCGQECKECEACDETGTTSALTLCTVDIETSNGHKLDDNKYFEITTDNKFLIFDRTKDGYTVDTWDDEAVMVINQKKLVNHENLYLLMDRTKSGYTVDTIEKYFESKTGQSKDYSIVKDIMENAFALQVKEDGSIGYKYFIKDCNSESGYTVKTEYSFDNIIESNKWSVVNVMFKILNGNTDKCGNSLGGRKMKVYIYVNGYLKFVSQELPELRLRELNEYSDKQEGVPFNISLGGGTQGLAESMWVDNYTRPYCKVLPIEENFGGSFIGDIRSFKFYNCQLQYNEIKNNYFFENRDDSPMYYFGFMPITTYNGKITQDTINQILTLSGNEIISMNTMNEVRLINTVVELTGGEDFVIPTEMTEEELSEQLKQGKKYRDIADAHNNCVVLLLPIPRYESDDFDIIDERFNVSMKDEFSRVNCVKVNGIDYALLCMFNDKWAYARIGKDKIISPLKLVMKL